MDKTKNKRVRKRKNKKNIGRIFLIVGLIVLIFLAYKLYRDKNPKSYDISLDIALDKDSSDFGLDKGQFIVRKKNTLISYNKAGKEIFKRTLKDDEKVHFYDDGKVYTSIKNRLNIYSIDSDKTIDTFNAKAKINKVEKLGKNYLIYTNKLAYIYDKNFKLVEEYEIKENIVGFDSYNKLTSIIGMDMNSGILTSSFYLYDEGKNYFKLKSADELFIKSYYLGENKNIVVTNRYIYLMDRDNIVTKKLIHKLRTLDIREDRISLVDGNQLLILDNNLDLIKSVKLGFDVKEISMRKDSTVLIGDKKIGIYENDNILEQDVEKVLSSIIDDSGVYVIFETGVERMSR